MVRMSGTKKARANDEAEPSKARERKAAAMPLAPAEDPGRAVVFDVNAGELEDLVGGSAAVEIEEVAAEGGDIEDTGEAVFGIDHRHGKYAPFGDDLEEVAERLGFTDRNYGVEHDVGDDA
jgi:hypothetical protein